MSTPAGERPSAPAPPGRAGAVRRLRGDLFELREAPAEPRLSNADQG